MTLHPQEVSKFHTFDFRDRHLVGIVGPFGSGKSTILDAIAFALYGRTPRVNRSTRSLIHQRADHAAVALRFEDGSAGTLNLSARGTAAHPHELLKVTGSRSTVLVENVVDLCVYRHEGPTEVLHPSYVASGNWTEVTTGFAGEARAFEAALRDGTVPVSSIESSYRSMVLFEAIRESGGRVVQPHYEEV